MTYFMTYTQNWTYSNKFYKDSFYWSWQHRLIVCSDNIVNCDRLTLAKLSVVLTASKLVIISYFNPDQAY